MRCRLLTVIVMMCCAGLVQAQSPLHEMVKTEQAFSKLAEEKTTSEAFMTFIADDGLLFRPGAVNGKKWMAEHPAPPPQNGKKPLLAWQPSFAGMAASGDIGFTTGPWEIKEDIKDEKAVRYGHFVTVWKKQTDGTWKFVVDLGISHPQSGGPQTIWTPAPAKEVVFKPIDVAEERQTLIDRDRTYSLAYAAPDIRLYREGNLPFIGVKAAMKALAKPKGQLTWKPIDSDVSRAGDLGYTHGTYEVTDDTTKVIERGSYVHIWKKQNGKWLAVMDVVNVHPQ